MGWDHLFAFNIALITAIVTPGPALLHSIRTTLAGGRAAGFATGLGLAVMAACWTLLALFAAAVLVVIFPPNLAVGEMALIAINHLLIEILFFGAFAFAIAAPTVSAGYIRAKPIFERIAAVVMATLGVRLATTD
jgi:threonine/homoserine/homoserine lactone efflux protein